MYRAARRKFNCARRKAKADLERERLRCLISECREQPRALWDRLRGPKGGTGPIAAARWKEHFEALLNTGHVEEAQAGEVDRAWQLMNVINGVPEGSTVEALMSCEGVSALRTAGDPFLNDPLSLEEIEGGPRSRKVRSSVQADRCLRQLAVDEHTGTCGLEGAGRDKARSTGVGGVAGKVQSSVEAHV
jgi:hypothetical protein